MVEKIMSDLQLIHGDCREIMAELEANSIDGLFGDAPYGLEFMGNDWDKFDSGRSRAENELTAISRGPEAYKAGIPFQRWTESWATEALRVLKPGGYLLVFGGTRTYHRLTCGIEDAGFVIKDTLCWLYGCLSEDTEILTINGWEHYHKTIDSSPVLCYDIEADRFMFDKPIRSFCYENQHTAYNIKSDETDQIVSRNHNCIVERDGRKVFVKAEALERKESLPFLESLHSLPETVPNLYSRTSIKKSDLLQKVYKQEAIKVESKRTQEGQQRSYLFRLREKIYNLGTHIEKSKNPNLFPSMQWLFERARVEKICPQGQSKLVKKIGTGIKTENDRIKQSRLEGWYNLFQEKGKLSWSKICAMSREIFGNGSQGWLCYGASTNSGSAAGKMLEAHRSSTSLRSRSLRKLSDKPSFIFKQYSPQKIRGSQNPTTTLATITPVEYEGKMWCIQVSTGAFVARRNGKIFITGNSGFPKSMNISKVFDKTGGKNTQWFIDYVIKFCEEKGIPKKRLTALFPSKNGKMTGWLYNKANHSQQLTVEQYNKIKDFLQLPFETIEEAEREIIGKGKSGLTSWFSEKTDFDITIPATDLAKTWDGYGTALKPAHEPIVLAQKPLIGTYCQNIQKYGVGALNIDGCRIGIDKADDIHAKNPHTLGGIVDAQVYGKGKSTEYAVPAGRFPANLILDEETAERLDEQAGISQSRSRKLGIGPYSRSKTEKGSWGLKMSVPSDYSDSGGPSRFFYTAKASQKERGKGNIHPTVKPIALMMYLAKLIFPHHKPVVWLDPFLGSGTSALAAAKLNDEEHYQIKFIGIDQKKKYLKIAEHRLAEYNKCVQLRIPLCTPKPV